MDGGDDLFQLAQKRLQLALGDPEPGSGSARWVLPRAGLADQVLTVTLQIVEDPRRISVLLTDPALPVAAENTVFIMQSLVELDALIASIRRRTVAAANAARA